MTGFKKHRPFPRLQVSWTECPKVEHHKGIRVGDWQCATCSILNFATRDKCHHCTTPREGRESFLAIQPIDPRDERVHAGDWQCSRCGDLVYARRKKCSRCKAPRNDTPAILQSRIMDIRPGDKVCHRCGVVVFAGKQKCFACRNNV